MAKTYTIGPRMIDGIKRVLGAGPSLSADKNRRAIDDGGTWFRITSSSQDGSNKRWVYSMTEVYKSGNGYGNWSDVPSGITTTKGYNGIEDQNGATGTYGVNIASTNLSGTFALKPLYTGCRIKAWPWINTSNEVEWWFCVANAVDGAC